MRVWWVKKPRPGNFGDIITPLILQHFGIDFTYDEDFNVISTGSIATRAKEGTIVLGSGIIAIRETLCPTADWRFVRGPITRNKVIMAGGYCPPIYGDPGLLLPLLHKGSKPEYEVGIIPHFADYDDVKSKHPDKFIIDILNEDPLKVVDEITKCRHIISSSLHGVICAHAYGIPAAWVRFSNNLKGDDTKFLDYFSSVGLKAELSTIDNPIYSLGKFNIDPIITIFQKLKYESICNIIK